MEGNNLLVFSIVFLVMAAGLVYLKLQLKRQKDYNIKFRHRYFKMLEATNAYLFEYDVASDEVRLSQACAELLHLPAVLPNYLDGTGQDALKKQPGFHYLEQAMELQTAAREVRIERQDKSLGVFRIYSETFYENGDKPAYIMGFFSDITSEFQRQERLATRAQIDGLTKVYNAGTCRRQLPDYVAAYDGTCQAAFLILDLDYFKDVNDQLGHQTGDKVLQVMARTVKAALRQSDFVGRLGGDEFCIYLNQVPSTAFVAGLCQRLNNVVTEAMAQEIRDRKITISIGAGMVQAGDDFDSVYKRADQALYASKAAGRNTFTVLEK